MIVVSYMRVVTWIMYGRCANTVLRSVTHHHNNVTPTTRGELPGNTTILCMLHTYCLRCVVGPLTAANYETNQPTAPPTNQPTDQQQTIPSNQPLPKPFGLLAAWVGRHDV